MAFLNQFIQLRPYFDAPLEPLSSLSPIIKQFADRNEAMRAMEKGVTAGDWFKRRIQKQRVANRKGPETWSESRGTERALAIAVFLRTYSRATYRLQTLP